MTIRVKLFLTLLFFSLAPVLLIGLVGRSNVSETRDALTESTRDRIVRIAEETRSHLVQKHAAILERDRALIEIDVRAAAEALRRVDSVGPDASSIGARLYTDADFDDPSTPPPGLAPLNGMDRVAEDGTRTRLLASTEVPVFVPPPGVPIESLRAEAEMLHSLVPTFRSVRVDDGELTRPASQYVALDGSRLHMSWPGKGGYPEDYDPHLRVWYQAAINAESAVVWTPPEIDAPTGQVRFTCTAPVYRFDGTLIGVTAADIRLKDILAELDLPETFGDNSQAMVVAAPRGALAPHEAPIILAAATYSEHAGKAWDSPISLKRFETKGNPEGGAELGRAMRENASGSINLAISGEPWIWTWERLSDQTSYVLVGISLAAADAAADEVAQEVERGFASTLRQSAAVGSVAVIAIVAFGFLGSRSITKPIRSLADAATAIAGGDLDARAEVSTGDELETLADSFNSMVPKLQDRLKVREALGIAREVQQNLLPKTTPDLPGIDIAALCVYSDETGGDYYDFLEVAGGSHAVLVGDVTGHGIGAALLMTTARALIHARAPESDDLPEVLGRVNGNLAVDSKSGQFMTLFYLLVRPEDRLVRWTSCGHDAAIVLDTDSGEFDELEGHDIPLGIDGSWSFHADERRLPERCVLVIGTDGIWEARDPSGEMFGKDRLRAVLAEHAGSDADSIARAILAAVVRFRDGGVQADDITLSVLRFG